MTGICLCLCGFILTFICAILNKSVIFIIISLVLLIVLIINTINYDYTIANIEVEIKDIKNQISKLKLVLQKIIEDVERK